MSAPAFVGPYDASPGDDCGLIKPDGSICPGELACWVDVLGKVPGCACHLNPPCGACLEAPLVCSTCQEIISE